MKWKSSMGWLLALSLALCLLVPSTIGRAHGIYQNWLYPDQRGQHGGRRAFPCCNNVDCKPRASKWVNDHWEVLWEGGDGKPEQWLRVPDRKVEQNYPDAWDPGDNLSHACISSAGNIYCFRAGEWLQ